MDRNTYALSWLVFSHSPHFADLLASPDLTCYPVSSTSILKFYEPFLIKVRWKFNHSISDWVLSWALVLIAESI